MQRFDYDLAVIGGGSAGYAAARTAAGAGIKTVVIEGGEQVGGLCILRGCMPSKALLYAAEVRQLARHAGVWGIQTKPVGFDFAKVMARKTALIREFADYRRQQLKAGKFEFIRAHARFLDPHTLQLASLAGNRGRGRGSESSLVPKGKGRLTSNATVRARNFIIATGSMVARPPLPQLAQAGYITSDHALSLKKLPKSLIVLGGGAVACELAQFFVRFDVKVTMIQRSEHILKDFDPDAALAVENVLRREGIRLFTNTQLLDAWRSGKRKNVLFLHNGKKTQVEAEEIFFALGRMPNLTGLGLENAGVKAGHPCLHANFQMQTNVPHIYAAGDCCGQHEIVHIAVHQGEVAAHNIAFPKQPRRMDYRLFTSIVFTDPQIAAVGLTEQDAAARKIPYLAASYPFDDHGKSLIMDAKDGFVKLLANPKDGEILGGGCVGPMGGELIHEIIAAMARRMTVHELAAMPHYHPTLAEIWSYPAEELAERIKPRR